MKSDSQQPNPYAPSTLYEPARERGRGLLHVPILTRGTIAWEDRRHGLLLCGWATFEDWGDFLIYNGIGVVIGGVLAVTVSYVPLLILLGIFCLRALFKLLRMQVVLTTARRAQEAHGNRLVERQITDDGIISTVNGQPVLLPWDSYQEGRLDDERIILLTQKRETFQIFPRSHFANEMDWGLFKKAVKRCVTRVR